MPEMKDNNVGWSVTESQNINWVIQDVILKRSEFVIGIKVTEAEGFKMARTWVTLNQKQAAEAKQMTSHSF